MSSINANDLKLRGIAAIADALANASEAVLSVRGKHRFVVMNLDRYRDLRDCEQTVALAESRADIAADHFTEGSVDAHMRLLAGLP